MHACKGLNPQRLKLLRNLVHRTASLDAGAVFPETRTKAKGMIRDATFLLLYLDNEIAKPCGFVWNPDAKKYERKAKR